MKKRHVVWIATALLFVLWAVSACAEPSQSDVTIPLIGDNREAVEAVDAPQQIVVILVTPTPAGDAAAGRGSDGSTDTPQDGTSDGNGNGEQMSQEQLAEQGSTIYTDNCAMCHGPNGEGGASYPPLVGSALLTAEDPTDAIDIVLHGRGQMPGFGNQLSNEQIAAVLTYERTSWDNDAPAIQVSDVEQVANGGQQQASQQQDQQQDGQQQQDQQQASQQQNGQQQDSQQTASTASTAGSGEIVIQLQIMVVTPESSGGNQNGASGDPGDGNGAEAEPEGTPTPTSDSSDNGDSEEQAQSGNGTDDQAQSGSSAEGQGSTIPIQIRVIVDTAGNVTLEPMAGAADDSDSATP